MLWKNRITLIETIVGVFLLLSFTTLVTTFVFKAKDLGWTEEVKYFSIRLSSSTGISLNTAVFIKGIPTGYVTDITIDEDNTILVTMLVQDRYAKRVTEGSVVEVIPPPLGFGTATINILPAGTGNPLPSKTMLTVKAMSEGIVEKAEGLAGTARTALNSGDRLFVSVNDLVQEWLVIFRDYNAGKGVLFDTVDATRATVTQLQETDRRLRVSLDELQAGLVNVKGFTADIAAILAEFRRGEGSLADLVGSTVNFTRDLAPAGKNIVTISDEVLGLVGQTRTAITQLSESRDTIAEVTASLKETMANVQSITEKIDNSQGALDQFINDPDIYVKVEDAVDTTTGLMKSLTQLKTYVRVQDEYLGGLQLNALSAGLRIEPRPSRYFYLGGVFLQPVGDSLVTTAETDDTLVLFPEVLIAQRVFDNRLTLKAGLIEGKVGGGFDWDIFNRRDEVTGLTISKLTWQVEGRDFYDDQDANFDENVDEYIVRTRFEYKFLRYFFLRAGVDDILNNAGYSIGFGFEYVDQDITTVVGIMNMK
ncbi:MAG: MlaD family protein [Planctomycetota bacterium]